MNVRPQVKERAEEQASAMSMDQQAAIRILANDLHRLNQAVMKAVEAGVSVELVRSARHHGGDGNWGDLLIPVVVHARQAEQGWNADTAPGGSRPAPFTFVRNGPKAMYSLATATHCPRQRLVVIWTGGPRQACILSDKSVGAGPGKRRSGKAAWRNRGLNPDLSRTGACPGATLQPVSHLTFPGFWSLDSRRSTVSWFARSSSAPACIRFRKRLSRQCESCR